MVDVSGQASVVAHSFPREELSRQHLETSEGDTTAVQFSHGLCRSGSEESLSDERRSTLSLTISMVPRLKGSLDLARLGLALGGGNGASGRGV